MSTMHIASSKGFPGDPIRENETIEKSWNSRTIERAKAALTSMGVSLLELICTYVRERAW